MRVNFLVALWGLAAVALASAVDRTLQHDDDRIQNLEAFHAW